MIVPNRVRRKARIAYYGSGCHQSNAECGMRNAEDGTKADAER
jgi:hypothetical protein